MTKKHFNREAWLVAATGALEEKYFKGNGYKLPKDVRVSCGFPRASAMAIGQCWDPKVSDDGTYEIFICPTQAAPIRVLDILLHELIHAAVGTEEGHKGKFRQLAKEFGLAGKMTATFAEDGSELHAELASLATQLGHYPHAAMTKKKKPTKPNKWVRYVSKTETTYRVVINEDRVEEWGIPCDFNGEEMELVERK